MRPIPLLIIVSLATLLPGCGPVFLPLSPRTTPEDQRQIDSMWDNMLTPAGRVPREALLDTMMTYWLYTSGVDRLHLVSEKYLSHGKAVMEADCARASPDTDQFTLTVLDDRGRTLRRERYLRPEIEDRAQALWDLDPNSIGVVTRQGPDATQPSTHPALTDPARVEHQLERDRRLRAVEAATRPARLESVK